IARTWGCLPVWWGFLTFIIPKGRLPIQANRQKKPVFREKTAQPQSSVRGSKVKKSCLQDWWVY
ncbi:MAG: hypothetical protein OXC62_13385, partial [Aestuariivita sp.]|nr:hypothetical protein [Aestuariivita sp.]